jgi:predicted RNA-binding Zn ribbon-like protein
MNTKTDPDAVPLVLAVREELCLDFANTLAWRGSDAPAESLLGFGDLLDWLSRTAELPAPMVAKVHDWAPGDPERAQVLFANAMAAREAIYGLFAAIAAGHPTPDGDLTQLNRALAAAPVRRQVGRRGDGFGWQIDVEDISVANLLAPVLWSAAELLLNASHRRIRRCANDRCLWLFLDTSKSGTRRWCDMSSCGNRAKARRHYSKVKAG